MGMSGTLANTPRERRCEMPETLTIGSLFSGILVGGLELGLERAGLGPVLWQAEIDPFCRRVLAKHWPAARRYVDVREVDGSAARVDVLCGGFPCQDLSYAGKGAGLAGERSGLWTEYARIVRDLRPKYVVVENVSALLGRGMGDVLGDLAALGYDAFWDCVPAAAVGAHHRRDRVFILAVAHAHADRLEDVWSGALLDGLGKARWHDADGRGDPWPRIAPQGHVPMWERLPADAQPAVCRGADRAARRMDRDRLTALGNAVVPQVAEVIGSAIVAAEGAGLLGGGR
jgi:DNA (cytosine-5)-methyltransferase 1